MKEEIMAQVQTQPVLVQRRTTFGLRRFHWPGWPTVIAYLLLILWAILSLMPLYWMISISFMNVVTLLRMPPKLIPAPFTLSNYERLMVRSMLPQWEFNSALIAITNTAVSLFVSSFYGYIFAKKVFPGRDLLFWVLI